jgi:hypothetical protein
MTGRFELRSPLIVALACLLGAVAGVIAMNIAAQALWQLDHGQSVLTPYLGYSAGGPAGALWSQIFWSLFELPFPLVVELLVGVPVVWFVVKRRPNWLLPQFFYVLGLMVGGLGANVGLALLAFRVGVRPVFALDVAVLGAGMGLVVASVFRALALRQRPQNIAEATSLRPPTQRA